VRVSTLMRRGVELAAMCAVACAARLAAADESDRTYDLHRRTSNKALFAAARYDVGERGSTYGLGVIHAWESGSSINGLGAFLWFGPGLELRVVTADHDAVDGLIVALPLRASGAGDAGGAGLELSGGLNATGDHLGVLTAGAFFGVYFLDFGYSYQLPVGGDRPDWLDSHQFSVRLQVPIHRYDRHEQLDRKPRR
jgi:hypothetical protein